MEIWFKLMEKSWQSICQHVFEPFIYIYIYINQFVFYSPTLQICPKGLYNLYSYDIPVPGPHIGSAKTPEKREETIRRATEEDPSPRMDRIYSIYIVVPDKAESQSV